MSIIEDMQCQAEIESPENPCFQCPEDGSEYHVINHYSMQLIIHLCPEHSELETAAINELSIEELRAGVPSRSLSRL